MRRFLFLVIAGILSFTAAAQTKKEIKKHVRHLHRQARKGKLHKEVFQNAGGLMGGNTVIAYYRNDTLLYAITKEPNAPAYSETRFYFHGNDLIKTKEYDKIPKQPKDKEAYCKKHKKADGSCDLSRLGVSRVRTKVYYMPQPIFKGTKNRIPFRYSEREIVIYTDSYKIRANNLRSELARMRNSTR